MTKTSLLSLAVAVLMAPLVAFGEVYIDGKPMSLVVQQMNTETGSWNAATAWVETNSNGLDYVLTRTNAWDALTTGSTAVAAAWVVAHSNRVEYMESRTDTWNTASAWVVGNSGGVASVFSSTGSWNTAYAWVSGNSNSFSTVMARTSSWDIATSWVEDNSNNMSVATLTAGSVYVTNGTIAQDASNGTEIVNYRTMTNYTGSEKFVFVNPDTGSDTTGDGTRFNPYKTITWAYSNVTVLPYSSNAITQWADEKIIFDLAPGVYNEDAVVGLKRARIGIRGDGVMINGKLEYRMAVEHLPYGEYYVYAQTGVETNIGPYSNINMRACLPNPWTNGMPFVTLDVSGNSAGGMEAGGPSRNLQILRGIRVTSPVDPTTYTGGGKGSAKGRYQGRIGNFFVLLSHVQSYNGCQSQDRTDCSITYEIDSSSINSTYTNAGDVGCIGSVSTNIQGDSNIGFSLKAANSQLDSVIGPICSIVEIDNCRINAGMDVTFSPVTGSTGGFTNGWSKITFDTAATRSGLSGCALSGSTWKLGSNTNASPQAVTIMGDEFTINQLMGKSMTNLSGSTLQLQVRDDLSGSAAQRTTFGGFLGASSIGYRFFDTNSVIPYWWSGTAWVTMAASNNPVLLAGITNNQANVSLGTNLTVGGNRVLTNAVGTNDIAQWAIYPAVTNVVPALSNAFDLGSALFPWRELYLSTNSLHLGTNTVNVASLSRWDAAYANSVSATQRITVVEGGTQGWNTAYTWVSGNSNRLANAVTNFQPSVSFGEVRLPTYTYTTNVNSNIMIVGSGGGLDPMIVSYDGGTVWTTNSFVQGLTQIRGSDNGKYLFGRTGVGSSWSYKSVDYGATWTSLGGGATWTLDCSPDGRLVVRTVFGTGVQLSSDYGNNWTTYTPLADAYVVGCCLSSNGSVVYCSSAGGGGYRSYDFGTNWTSMATCPSSRDMDCSDDGRTVWATRGTPSDIFKSSNSGTNWASSHSTANPCEYLLCSSDGTTVLAAPLEETWNEQHYTTNGGSTWTGAALVGSHNRGIGLSKSGQRMFVCDNLIGVVMSTNAGVTWTTNTTLMANPSVATYFDSLDIRSVDTNMFYTNMLTQVLTNGQTGVVLGNITPPASNAYDLGSPTMPFRSIYASTGSVWIGQYKLGANVDGTLTYNGNPVVSTGGVSYATDTNMQAQMVAVTGRVSVLEAGTQGWNTAWAWVDANSNNLSAAITNNQPNVSLGTNIQLGAGSKVGGSLIVTNAVASGISTNMTNNWSYAYSWVVGSSNSPRAWAMYPATNSVVITNGLNLVGSVGVSTFTYNSTLVASTKSWYKVQCSSDGSNVFAAAYGDYLWKSTDGGSNWATMYNVGNWSDIDCSSNGTYLHAVGSGSYTYTSADGGANWVSNSTYYTDWGAVAMSADGQRLVGGMSSGGNFYKSTNAGVEWVLAANAGVRIKCIDINAAGDYMILGGEEGDNLMKTAPYPFTSLTARWYGARFWGLSMSGDGQKILGFYGDAPGRYVLMSLDAGVSWQWANTNLNEKWWSTVAVAPDGGKMALAVWTGQIYVSDDNFATYAVIESSRQWSSLDFSEDGSRLYASVYGGGIYVINLFTAAPHSTIVNFENASWDAAAVNATSALAVAASATQRVSVVEAGTNNWNTAWTWVDVNSNRLATAVTNGQANVAFGTNLTVGRQVVSIGSITTTETVEVTGEITPDATGLYLRGDDYEGYPAFLQVKLGTNWWVIYSDVAMQCLITVDQSEFPTLGAWSGDSSTTNYVDTYSHSPPASGTATVTVHAATLTTNWVTSIVYDAVVTTNDAKYLASSADSAAATNWMTANTAGVATVFQGTQNWNTAWTWVNANSNNMSVGSLTAARTVTASNMVQTAGGWSDMTCDANNIRVQGTVNVTANYVSNTVDFAATASTNFADDHIYFTMQFPHSWATGTVIYPHLHFIQSSSDQTNGMWVMLYKWYNLGDAVPSTWNVLLSQSNAFSYTSGSIHQIAPFTTNGISGSGKAISSLLDVKIYRQGGIGTGAVGLKQFDIHVRKDSLGSDQEFSKSF